MKEVRLIKRTHPVSYQELFAEQLRVHEAVRTGEAPNTLFLLEHNPVITLGRRARVEHILADKETLAAAGVDCVETDRGGDVTYHGPGQLVAYPILNLNEWRLSVDWYLRALEETLITLLHSYGVTAERMEGYTGVWVEGAKVAAIGVGVRQWVTWHGIALNVAPNEAHWQLIIPCGIKDKAVTTLSRLLQPCPPMEEVMDRFTVAFAQVFQCKVNSHAP
ncbi:MAG: lipoyl(octanoyl) transferase LipB [Candidatus Hydrogenedentes bacterium]|jgi:lipoyl(octanoyl) transferase|nr:lipoyl(octanoyl) transferase LipB [Candidatus Hydrogenedentota bacterium]